MPYKPIPNSVSDISACFSLLMRPSTWVGNGEMSHFALVMNQTSPGEVYDAFQLLHEYPVVGPKPHAAFCSPPFFPHKNPIKQARLRVCDWLEVTQQVPWQNREGSKPGSPRSYRYHYITLILDIYD